MVILEQIYDNLKEEKHEKDRHQHYCIDELVSLVKAELNRLYKFWDQKTLSCVKIKETLKKNGIDLYQIGAILGKFNDTIEKSKGGE